MILDPQNKHEKSNETPIEKLSTRNFFLGDSVSEKLHSTLDLSIQSTISKKVKVCRCGYYLIYNIEY